MQTLKVQEDFIQYFRNNGHKLLKPSKIFIEEDKTLLFTNSGMCQLKDLFLGKKEPEENYKELTNAQICVRAGGKHNDLDDVGLDSRHLTSFSMIGNWSLGTYGKERAIELAFKFLVDNIGLDRSRIYVTYFEGNIDIPQDTETKEIWKKYLPENHIVPGSSKDNFWVMADTDTPCGSCTELHYDRSDDPSDKPELVNIEPSPIIELWNIVFMEYYKSKNTYTPLKNKFVDTGAGLSRIAMILQNKKSIYQTDEFSYLIAYCQSITYQTNQFTDEYDPSNPNFARDCGYRIFADHIRTLIICLFDGVQFDISSRGNVLRKIMRRMLTHLYLDLNNSIVEPLMKRVLIKGIISDVLNYHMKRQHDYNDLHQKLINEELLFIGHIRNIKTRVEGMLKKNDMNTIIKMLKEQSGISEKIVLNYDKLQFKNL